MNFTVNISNEVAVDSADDLAEIIRIVSNDVAEGDLGGAVRDLNGNIIGHWEVEV